MTVGVLLLTEDGTGAALLNQLRRRGQDETMNVLSLTINEQMSETVLCPHIEQRIAQLDTGNGVLILTDVVPEVLHNILTSIHADFYLRVVSGINQAMLNAVLEHSDADLDAMARFALNGARQGIQIAFSSDGDTTER